MVSCLDKYGNAIKFEFNPKKAFDVYTNGVLSCGLYEDENGVGKVDMDTISAKIFQTHGRLKAVEIDREVKKKRCKLN